MFELKPLPYPKDALEPVISKRTVEYHYLKHHAGYVKKLNELIAGTMFENQTLETIILSSYGSPRSDNHAIFNQAAQVWNHDFCWASLSPEPSIPSGSIVQAIGEFPGDFRETWLEKGQNHFGSGWLWLFADSERKLYIETTSNAMNPMVDGYYPLLTLDLWEHQRYLDYQSDVKSFLLNTWTLLNWNFAVSNYEKAQELSSSYPGIQKFS